MVYCKVVNSVITEYNKTPQQFGLPARATDADCIAVGWYPVHLNDVVLPADQKVTGFTYTIDGNSIIRTQTTEALTAEELFARSVRAVEDVIDELLQSEVDSYNFVNGTEFFDIHSCESYKDSMAYTHQPFCLSVWDWQTLVWDTARGLQADIIAGNIPEPTLDEFIAMLPAHSFNQ